jgi:hypothetical protein
MKLIDEEEMSCWAFCQCLNGNDTEEMKDLITNSWDAYWYCRNIKDREEMWKNITTSYWAKEYCRDMNDKKRCGDI